MHYTVQFNWDTPRGNSFASRTHNSRTSVSKLSHKNYCFLKNFISVWCFVCCSCITFIIIWLEFYRFSEFFVFFIQSPLHFWDDNSDASNIIRILDTLNLSTPIGKIIILTAINVWSWKVIFFSSKEFCCQGIISILKYATRT